MRRCTVCQHKDLAKINEALIAGQSYRGISGQFNLSKSAVERHAKKHLPATLVKAKEASEIANADGLLSQVCSLRDRTLDILGKAETTGKLSVALRAIQVAQGNIELLARLLIEIEKHRLADAERKPSAAEELVADIPTRELERRYFILCDTRRITIDDALEEIENILKAKPSGKDVKILESKRRELAKAKDGLVQNIEVMRWSIRRSLEEEGE